METIVTIIGGILIAAASSWITVQLSLRRFQAEKWWEKRIIAYERLIEAFHASKSFSEIHIEAAQRGREVSDSQDNELRAKAKEASLEIARATDLSAFLLGDEACARLKKYKEDQSELARCTDWAQYLIHDWESTNSCLQDLIEIARRDLNKSKARLGI